MNYPIVELITRDLEHALSRVQKAAGYHNDFKVERRKRHQAPSERKDGRVVLYQMAPRLADDGPPQGRMCIVQPYGVVCFVLEAEGSATSLDERLNYAWADVAKAVTIDRHRGNRALDTEIGLPEPFGEDPDNPEGCIVPLLVTYYILDYDPYTQG